MIRELYFRGSFYPKKLYDIKSFISENLGSKIEVPNLKGLIVPHAGWIYSGYTACKGFCHLPASTTKKIYLIGPSHRHPFNGVALSTYKEYETPLGNYHLDKEYQKSLLDIRGVEEINKAHLYEHSLEVELSFLKTLFPDALLIPIVAGGYSTGILTEIISKTLKEENSITIISSDLSHFLTYEEAKERDMTTIDKIITGSEPIASDDACGSVIINSLLDIRDKIDIKLNLIDYKNSGDTAGDRERVVGYSSMEIIVNG